MKRVVRERDKARAKRTRKMERKRVESEEGRKERRFNAAICDLGLPVSQSGGPRAAR